MIYDFSVIKSPTPWRGGGRNHPLLFLLNNFWTVSAIDTKLLSTWATYRYEWKWISNLTQAVSSWLNSDSNDDQRELPLTRLKSLIFTTDSTLTLLIWVRVESNLTHSSMSRAQPVSKPHLWMELQTKSIVRIIFRWWESFSRIRKIVLQKLYKMAISNFWNIGGFDFQNQKN